MRARHWTALLALAAMLAAHEAKADPVGRYIYVAPMGGFTLFPGDYKWPANSIADGTYVGGRLGYRLSPLWAVELAGGITPTKEDVENGESVSLTHASGEFMMTPWTGMHGGPFLFLGGGAGRLSSNRGVAPDESKSHLNQGLFEAGGGVRMWLTDALGVRLEARVQHWLPKEDMFKGKSVNYVTLSGGLTLAIGAKARDTDGDGVPDSHDKCPGTPKGAKVDKNGCPLDTDGDAVYDGLDKCPDTPKGSKVAATGCHVDTDGDGVCDGVDTCPDTPKGCTVDAKGCPSDSDGDGVCDGVDKCPNTPKGCVIGPDGCPVDSDGDGVCDGLDQCPNTPAGLKVDEKGCPIEIIERETELMDTGKIRLQNVQFDTGKADLKPESFDPLNIVGQVLTQWPTLRIEIAGHTDDVGGNAANLRLSQARAQSVLNYLKGKFPAIDSTRFVARGYGEERPLVPNISDENRAKNRRVEFTVLNKDVLQKEVERRRLLKQGETAPADTTKAPVETPKPPADTTTAPADTTGGK